MEDNDSALEQFRKQWRDEVQARANPSTKDASKSNWLPPPLVPGPGHAAQPTKYDQTTYNGTGTRVTSEITASTEPTGWDRELGELTLSESARDQLNLPSKEPESALEHFEKGVEKEGQGNLGESLSHYRKAYRLDSAVDRSYRQKYFPTGSKSGITNPSNASTLKSPGPRHPSKGPGESLSTSSLISSFGGLPIVGASPVIEGDVPPACPISSLPTEILHEILVFVAIRDPACFAKLALVCKRLAFLVFMENQVWKRVAVGPEFGLRGQVYDFQTDVLGRQAFSRALDAPDPQAWIGELARANRNWRDVFHSHPRLRYTGVYISTVNYTRPGGISASQVTWNTPVHIVTYYRYLRFFRDGTAISLLTTSEPVEVVHHLTKENLALVRGGKEQHPLNFTSNAPATNPPATQPTAPTAHQLLKHALRGRWRLCHPLTRDSKTAAETATSWVEEEGDVYIETEGAGPRYLYTMHLALRSSSKAEHSVKNNKLQWKGFSSYNQLTNDWAPFQLKNDRAFFFSRVKSYGLGY